MSEIKLFDIGKPEIIQIIDASARTDEAKAEDKFFIEKCREGIRILIGEKNDSAYEKKIQMAEEKRERYRKRMEQEEMRMEKERLKK